MIKSKKLDLSSLKKIFLIAECGVNHNGNLNYAKKLISGAKKAGFDAVKFQTYNVDYLVEKSTQLANYQKKTKYKSQYYMLKKYSFSKEEFLKLKNYCDKINIVFMSTPFCEVFVSFLLYLSYSKYTTYMVVCWSLLFFLLTSTRTHTHEK